MCAISKNSFALAAIAVSACGDGGGAGNSVNYDPIFRTLPGDLLESTVAIDSSLRNVGSSTGHGATGIMAMSTFLGPNPVLKSFKVRLSEDRQTAYLDISGLPEITMAADGTPNEFSGFWGEFFDGHHISLMHFDSEGQISYTDSTNIMSQVSGRGHYGLETPVDRLPTSVTYSGTADGLGHFSSITATNVIGINGTFDMTVDFASDTLSGTTGGSIIFNAGNSAATGTISGTAVDGSLGGTMTFDGGGHSVTTTFAGATYGWDATRVGGAFIGTFNISGGGSQQVYGDFEGDNF